MAITVWVLAALWAAWAVVRGLGLERGWVAVCAVAFTPYAALTAPVPLVVALVARQWLAAGVAGAALVWLAAAVLPRAVGRPERGYGPVLRVLTANLLHGDCDPDALFSLVREHDVELLAMQEYTPHVEGKLLAIGLGDLLPHRFTVPRVGGRGSALYCRHPLSSIDERLHPGGHRGARATVEIPGASAIDVESIHPASLYARRQLPFWRAGLAALADDATADDHPIRVLLGDVNATLDQAPLRALLRAGYRDAAAVVGRGLVPTWPYTGYGPVPRITLDHVLADRRILVGAVTVHRIPGSDHRAVYAELILPVSPPESTGTPS